MRIVYMGSPTEAIYPLEFLLQNKQHELCAVVTQPAQLAGRGRQKKKDPPLADFAKQKKLLVLQPERARDPEFLQELANLAPDIIITCAYGQILSEDFLAIPKRATINIHPSLLPRFRGATPVQSFLLSQDRKTGVSILFTVKALDAGNIILQRDFPVQKEDRADTLLARLFKASGPMLLQALKILQDKDFTGSPQDPKQVSSCTKISKEMGLIHWQDSARKIYSSYQAFSSWPGVFTFHHDKRILITELCYLQTEEQLLRSRQTGDFLYSKADKLLIVKTGRGTLGIKRLKPAGSKEQEAQSFWNGLTLELREKGFSSEKSQ